jgi:phospholipase C
MKRSMVWIYALTLFLVLAGWRSRPASAEGNLSKVNHVIIVMQENHSFENYFGVLPYAAGTPYRHGPCGSSDHGCVDGLSCNSKTGAFSCTNFNRDSSNAKVYSFHSTDYCVYTDLDHSWTGVHRQANFDSPNSALSPSPNNGFVLDNDLTNQPGSGVRTAETMSFYNEDDLGFYYGLAETFAIDDHYFAAVPGPTFPNRSYWMAATSFGHLQTSEVVPDESESPELVYQPIAGTIFDLLDKYNVSWTDYYQDIPQGASFRNYIADQAHFRPFDSNNQPSPPLPFNPNNGFLQDVAAGTLLAVSFLDANAGVFVPAAENDEHPGSDIRAGQATWRNSSTRCATARVGRIL